MREAITREIDGEEYTFHQLAPKKSLRVLTKLMKILGGTAGKAVSSASSSADLLNGVDAGSIISGIAERLDEDEVIVIVDIMFSTVLHSGEGDVSKAFDKLFGGRVFHLIKVLQASLEVEYQDFFDEKSGIASMVTRIKSKAAVTSPAS